MSNSNSPETQPAGGKAAGLFSRHRKFLLGCAVAGGLLATPAFLTGGLQHAFQPGPAEAQITIDPQNMARAPLSFADIVQKVSPAVVSVKVTVDRADMRGMRNFGNRAPNMPDLPEGHPFNEFFKRFFDERQFGDRDGRGDRTPRNFRRGFSQGSGFVISKDGYVVTNNHVIDKASKVELTFQDGSTYDAEVIGADDKTDLALLKINADKNFAYVELGENEARVGDWVVAVGNPFGLGGSVTAGIVSARGRDIGAGPYDDFLQIDAAVNRGNSGGPAFSLDGKVVGVNTAIFSPSGGNVGVAFAIPATTVKSVVTQLKENGVVTRGWLGVAIQSMSEDMAESLGLDEANGAIITQVNENSPAEKGGLKSGDAVLSVNGRTIADAKDLARTVAGLLPNEETEVKVLRDGKEQTLKVTLGQMPGADQVASAEPAGEPARTSLAELGMDLAPASEVDGADVGVVVLDVDPDSEAAYKGIRSGDVILEVGGRQVASPADIESGLKQAEKLSRKAVMLKIRSGENQRFVALPLKKA